MAGKKKKGGAQRPAEYLNPREVCQDIIELYLMAVFGIFPLIFGLGEYGYGSLVEAKTYFWLGVTLLCFLCLGGYLIWCRTKKLSAGVSLRWFHSVSLAFLMISILSACLSQSPLDSFLMLRSSNTNGVFIMATYVAAFIGASLFGCLKAVHIRLLGIAALLSGILAFIQLAGYNPLAMYPEGLTYYNKYQEYTGAYLGTLGNVDVLAAFLCFAVPVLMVFALRSEQKRDRLLLIPGLLSLYILVKCDVDAGKVGLLGGVILIPPVAIRNPKWAKRAGILCGAAAVLGLAAVYFWPGKSGFLYQASSILHGHIKPSFGHDRVKIWQETWKSVVKNPVLGNGPGSAAWLIDFSHVNEEMNRIVSTRNAHNVYLGYLLETGILGLGCYLTLIGAAYIAWIRNRGDDILAALGAGLACYLIQDFFSLNLVPTAPFLWIGLGLLLGKNKKKD